jgi:hypothetical protein
MVQDCVHKWTLVLVVINLKVLLLPLISYMSAIW